MSDATSSDDDRNWLSPQRTLALTDGVVAIAMTLLALDLRPTLPAQAGSRALGHYLGEHVAQYATFAIAFALIAQYWVAHHRYMHSVRRATPRLVAETMLFLFAVTVIPLTTYLDGKYENALAYTIFAADVFLVSAALGLMGETIHRARLDERSETDEARVRRRLRSLTSLLIPVLAAGLVWVIGLQASWIYLLFFLADYPGSLAARRMRSA